MTNEYKIYNLTKEKSKNDTNNIEFKSDNNCKNLSNNINIKNTHTYIDAGKIKTLNKMDTNGNYKDENCLQNGSNICKTNNSNEDNTKYKCQIYQKNKGIIKNNVFKINGNDKNLCLNNGSAKTTENGSPKIINNKGNNNNNDKIYQPSQTPSSMTLGEKYNKIKIRKKMDNKFKIKNFYKITNKEKEPKREVKKKEKEELSVEDDEEEEENEEEKDEDNDIEDEEEDDDDDDISETEEETEETVSDDDDNNKKYINIEKTRNKNKKFKYINNSNSEINNDSTLKNDYLNSKRG